ncbi:MAG: virulence factor family protein [Pseudoxanthomonas sp.]|nr:virulence factor family protein [Pseudoxanthomonas sp.]
MIGSGRIVLLVGLLLASASASLRAQEKVSHGHFEDVALYRPHGAANAVVLLVSGDDGWGAHDDRIARGLATDGALVAGIDGPRLRRSLHADGGDCVLPTGDLENLSHYLQGYAQLPTYRPPLLVGEGSGGALAYAMLALADPGTFGGAVSVGFAPRLDLGNVPCKGAGVVFDAKPGRRKDSAVALRPVATLPQPWLVLQGDRDARFGVADARAFAGRIDGAALSVLPGVDASLRPDTWSPRLRAAARELARRAAPVPVATGGIAGLPVIEVPSQTDGDTFAILLSGDGGWAGLDKDVAAALAARGIPVAGFDSLRYFWKPRTPQGLADDLARITEHYAAQWQRPKVLLVGYSQGADVLPFAVNRLPAATRERVARTVLLGLGERAAFEFHLDNWIGGDHDTDLPILPEALRLDASGTLCIHGDGEDDSLCPKLAPGHARALALPGGHHFDGDYARLAAAILGDETAATAPAK